jgi:hypothetical protein
LAAQETSPALIKPGFSLYPTFPIPVSCNEPALNLERDGSAFEVLAVQAEHPRAVATLVFQDYKSFGGPLVATKLTARTGDHMRTFTYKSVTYEPLADSGFELPQAVKALLK